MHTAQASTLKNGARLIMVPAHDTQALTVVVLFEVGSRHETRDVNGASHFVEHMMFKGTKRRPTTMDISRDLDSVGADYNAFTGKDHTGYYIKLNADHADLAVDMLHDMIFHSNYKHEDCEKERDVILEEINMYEDNPIMHAEEILEAEIYGDTPLGWNISGTHQTMKGISRPHLLKFRDQHYIPQKMVIAVAGKIPKGLRALVEKTFGSIPKAKRLPKPYKKGHAATKKATVRIKYKETEQVQFVMGVPAFPYGHKNAAALSCLSVALGGGMSSRLFDEIRVKRGLAYSIHAMTSPYQDIGNFAIQAGLAKNKVHEGIETIMGELRKVVKNGITKEELVRAQEYIKGKTVLGLEESAALAEFYAKQELLQRKNESPEDKMARISAVTRADVKRVAGLLFKTNRISAAIIGPFKDPKPFIKLLKI